MHSIHLPQQLDSVPAHGAAAPPHPLDCPAANRPPVRSLYIHTPFCVHKCHYCDFYSFVDTRGQQPAFIDRLIRELRALAPAAHDRAGRPAPLRTIFVGGGTPSLLRIDLWDRLLAALHEHFDLSLIRDGGEFTVECNPESTTPELLRLLAAGGVNRVSIGAQSFDPRHLRTLERRHDPANVSRALDLARAAGIPRQSIDLIFAIPGQTLDDWRRDLDKAVALGTSHLSCYNLTYEPKTAMTARLSRGDFTPTDDDTEEAMFRLTVDRLRDAGFHRYEVSNFAHTKACPDPARLELDTRSAHNLAYWRQDQWLAAGPSASGHAWAGPDLRAGSSRWKNAPHLGEYLACAPQTNDAPAFAPIIDLESPDPARLIRERLMMGLRLAEGIDRAAITADLAVIAPGSLIELDLAFDRAHDAGWLETIAVQHHSPRTRLTDGGFLLCDHVAATLMAAVEPPSTPSRGVS